ncbi:MAG TPA: YcaO-like family protein [Candidatus Pullichristensenella excrementigallinarum]|uniref:YcaO-like family protein n=1 Tax=Candidatus Pullichristensenella excrementigallinarum TaxID=2840907 RepID=A0A9D1IBG5_9FIRM|nr:YcaO-like family protein [Candidatus Pullichristensenella excrementigallinarum]
MDKIGREKAYKALPPLQTVLNARRALAECDLFLFEQYYVFPVPGVSCCRIWLGDEEIEPLNIGVNGKGMNARYAQASAYGEMMERLQNGALFPMRQRRYALEKGALLYHYAPDERYLTSREAAEECGDVVEAMFHLPKGDAEAFLARTSETDRVPCVPFYSVMDGCSRLLPAELIWRAAGTNGMCAGNTPREAILQGLSEIAERYAICLLYLENTPPPVIPESVFAGTEVLRRLDTVRTNGLNYEIRDCSMGRGLPVIGLRLMRQDGSFAFHLGADPSPVTALERCLTEMFQGKPEDIDRRYHKMTLGTRPAQTASQEEKTVYWGHFTQSIASGFGAWPECICQEGAAFKGFRHARSISDEADLDDMVRSLAEMGASLFIRDNSYLGFPAYQVFIPGMSEVDFMFDAPDYSELLAWTDFAREHRTLLTLPSASSADRKRLADAVRRLEDTLLTDPLEPAKWFFSSYRLPQSVQNRFLFEAIVYAGAECWKDAERAMNRYLADAGSENAPRRLLMAVGELWGMRGEGASEGVAHGLLVDRYGEKVADRAVRYLENALSTYPNCADCETCPDSAACPYLRLIARQRFAQEKMAGAAIRQEDLGALFPRCL